MLAAFALPEFGAFHLADAAAARRPEDFPAGPAEAVLAALALSRALPAPADPTSLTRRVRRPGVVRPADLRVAHR
ncbi:hypothetical protein ACWEOA_08810 [Streptomyces sp. NPDC004457]